MSTSHYILLLRSEIVSWHSKYDLITPSRMGDAEFMISGFVIQEPVWFHTLVQEIKYLSQ